VLFNALSSIVLNGIKLEILVPLHWLMLTQKMNENILHEHNFTTKFFRQ